MNWIFEAMDKLKGYEALENIPMEIKRLEECFYIYRAKGNVDRLCEELGREKSVVYDRRDKALRHFTIALYGIGEN